MLSLLPFLLSRRILGLVAFARVISATSRVPHSYFPTMLASHTCVMRYVGGEPSVALVSMAKMGFAASSQPRYSGVLELRDMLESIATCPYSASKHGQGRFLSTSASRQSSTSNMFAPVVARLLEQTYVSKVRLRPNTFRRSHHASHSLHCQLI